MRWKISHHHGHDPRLLDLLAIIVIVITIAAAWFYTGGSNPYGYQGFGELFVFVFFGLVAVLGTTYAQLESINQLAVWLAIGVFLLVSTGDSLGMGLPRRKRWVVRGPGCARSVVTRCRRCWRSRTPHHEANLSPRVHPRSSGVRRPALPPTHRVP